MSRNGSGTEVIPNTFTPGQPITASQHNENWADIGAEMTNSLPRDGQAGMVGQFKAASGTLAAPSIAFTSAPSTGIYKTTSGVGLAVAGAQVAEFTAGGLALPSPSRLSGLGSTPIGFGPAPWSGLTAPTGWLLWYGRTLLRATYPDLWTYVAAEIAAGNTLFGSGDGSTTFTLKDLRGVTLVGNTFMGGAGTPATNLDITYYGADPGLMGALGGTQSKAVGQTNLPAVSLPVTGVSLSITNGNITIPTKSNGASSGAGASSAQGSVDGGTNQVAANSGTVGITINSQGTVSLGGSGVPISAVSPSAIVNYIIYAGV